MRTNLMQQVEDYRQRLTPVNVPLRKNQTHCVHVRVGQARIRISGNFETVMGWVWLALAQRRLA